MKRHSRIFITGLIILCMGFTVSCTKEGDVGPRGEDGVHGVDGEDGTRIYTGSAAPTADIGDIGDFYFRTSNSDFYGPKSDAGWGTATNLRGATGATGPQGPQGPAGAAGSKILSGTAVPTTGTGAVGDFYFRTTTGDFYGPKTATSWGTPINLKGVKGEDGSRIYSGTTVPATSLGVVGDFYFRTTTSDFYGPKTASSWGTPTNLNGATGPQGPAGTPGSKIRSGASTPTTSIGAVGDYYIHTGTANLYGPKTASGWGSPVMNLRGPQGPEGPPGKDGEPGTANVIYSNWYVIDTYIQQGYGIAAPQLTQAIMDRGQILVYRRYNNGKVDYVEQLGGEVSGASVWYFVQPGNIFIYYHGTLVIDGYHAVRYVLIPGSVLASTNVDLRDFNQVKTMFHIPD